MESARRRAFSTREAVHAFVEFSEERSQNITIAGIVSGVIGATGAGYMLLGALGLYSNGKEFGMQLVVLGCVISAVAFTWELQCTHTAKELLNRVHEILPGTCGISSPSWPGLESIRSKVNGAFRLLLCLFCCVDFLTAAELGLVWTVLINLLMAASNIEKVSSLSHSFKTKESSKACKPLRKSLQELDKALYGGTP